MILKLRRVTNATTTILKEKVVVYTNVTYYDFTDDEGPGNPNLVFEANGRFHSANRLSLVCAYLMSDSGDTIQTIQGFSVWVDSAFEAAELSSRYPEPETAPGLEPQTFLCPVGHEGSIVAGKCRVCGEALLEVGQTLDRPIQEASAEPRSSRL